MTLQPVAQGDVLRSAVTMAGGHLADAPDGAFVVDARIKVTPYEPQDPFLRRLR